ncbi:MAG TPA: diacylglycerol kinase family protein, partial [Nocardioidaceae bacterium]|nr:diacylglycerol kinase family protein [Nocardioidaceae bacterium]
MAREIVILTNPTSGKGRGIRIAKATTARLRDAGCAVRSLVGRDAEEARDLAKCSVAEGIDTLVVVGGDGMVHLGAQAVVGSEAALGIVPAGSGNDVARCLEIPRSDPSAATDVLL